MIQIQQTPNPDSLKFLSEKQILVGSVQEYKKNDLEKIKINFIRELLSFEGVELILVSEKFISVNKDNQTSWDVLKPTIVSHINDYIAKNKLPINNNDKDEEKNPSIDETDETISKIKEVLDTKIRPAVAKDGGDIKFNSFSNGVVKLELKGSCSGCPSSTLTLKQGVQNLLKHYVKEVVSVEAV